MDPRTAVWGDAGQPGIDMVSWTRHRSWLSRRECQFRCSYSELGGIREGETERLSLIRVRPPPAV